MSVMKRTGHFVFVVDSPDKRDYVGVDSNSGGYAFLTKSLVLAHLWQSIDEATKYHELWLRGTGYKYLRASEWELREVYV